MVERELLGARMQLDAARAALERALGLGERVAVRVEPAEGNRRPSVPAASSITMSLAAR